MNKRLSLKKESAILQLHELNKTQTEIAAVVGCGQSTVSAVIRELADTRQQARAELANGAQRLAKRVVDEADVDQALEVLDRLEVAPKRHVDTGRAGQVNIVIGMPGQPAGPDPILIDLSPVPRNDLACGKDG